MKIGIDLDEVTINLMDPLLEYYRNKTGRNISRGDIKDYAFWKYISQSKKQANQIINQFFSSEHFDNISPAKGAIEGIINARKQHDLYIITSRYGIAREKTPLWIERNLKNLISQVFYSSDHKGPGMTKAEICKENNIEMILEDDPKISIKCAEEKISVILFKRPWNERVKHKYITPVYSWSEALKEIKNLSQNT